MADRSLVVIPAGNLRVFSSHPASQRAYNHLMAASETISITLPPDLLTQAESIAKREHRTVSELVGEALRTYADEKSAAALQEFKELAEDGRIHGKAMGINSQEDIDRILGEFRTPGLG